MPITYVVPEEHYVFKRDSRYLIFDPENFIWFVTDDNGRIVLDALSRTGSATAAAHALANTARRDPQSPEVGRYVEHYVSYLLKIGFLHLCDYNRIQLPSGVADRPKVLYIHLTSKCNLQCPYCYNQKHRSELIQLGNIPDSSTLSTEGKTEEFLRITDEAAQMGFVEVKLTGGEATLNRDFLRVAERAKSNGMRVNLLTNGTLITPDLARHIAGSVDSVSLSIDSANPKEHDAIRGNGTHAKVVDAITLLREAGVKCIHVNAVITPVNIDSVGRFLDYAYNTLKADKVTIAGSDLKVDDAGNRRNSASYELTEQQQYQLYDQIHEFYKKRIANDCSGMSRMSLFRTQCGAGNGVVSMDANGDIYPCQALHYPEFYCGNAFRTGLSPVLDDSPMLGKVRDAVVDVLPKCKSCAMRYVCGGGCRAEVFTREGDFLASNEAMCRTYFARALDKLWNSSTVPVQAVEAAGATMRKQQ